MLIACAQPHQTDIPAHAPSSHAATRDGVAINADRTRIAPPARLTDSPAAIWLCTHSAGFKHDVLPEARKTLHELGAESGPFTLETTDDAAAFSPGLLRRTHVVILYTTGPIPIDSALLTEWVENGGVLIGIHSATDTLSDDPVYVTLIGGTFDGHPWNEEVRVRVDDPFDASAAAFIDPSDAASVHPTFQIADEIYQFKNLNPDNSVILSLVTTDDKHAAFNARAADAARHAGLPVPQDPPEPYEAKLQPGRTYPLAWKRDVGKGRVFYTALGHRPEVWRDTRFREHLTEAIRTCTQDTGDRTCTICGAIMERLPIGYGMPLTTPDPHEEILGGCVIYPGSPQFGYRCFHCDPAVQH